MRVFKKQACVDIRGKNVAGNSNRNRTLIGRQSLLDVSDGIGEEEFHAVGFRLPWLESKRGRWIPLLNAFPLVVRISLAMDHPLIEAFERDSAWCRVGENGRGTEAIGLIKDRVVSLELRI